MQKLSNDDHNTNRITRKRPGCIGSMSIQHVIYYNFNY